MFDKRHRITLLFNANKAYDRQVVEGGGGGIFTSLAIRMGYIY